MSIFSKMSDKELEAAITSAINDKDNKSAYKLVDKLLEERDRRKALNATTTDDVSN